ncbi:MAG: hypothetical protein V4610_01765 [Pseudomonadota bacterium]|jgi:uncharacterized membrane protein YoaK (UPF0700 family)
MFTRYLATLFEALTFVSAMAGTAILFSGLLPGNSAIQTAASSATAVAFVALPYALAGIFHRNSTRNMMLLQIELLTPPGEEEQDAPTHE